MYIADDWQEYEVIDTGEGMKYEALGAGISASAGSAGHLAL